MRNRTRIDEGRRQLKAFLRSEAGAAALIYLRSFTVEAVPGPDVSEAALRFQAGKAALVKQLETLADEEEATHD